MQIKLKKQKLKRKATCKALEDSYFLQIPQSSFKEVMMQVVEKEQDKKLKLLLNLRMFRSFEPFSLVPIANVLMPKKYRYGEIIIKEGEMMNALFFLSTGRVRLVKKQLEFRSKQPSKCIQHLQKPPTCFNCGVSKYYPLNANDKKKSQKKEDKIKFLTQKHQINLNSYSINQNNNNKKERLYSFSKPDQQKYSKDDNNAFYNIIEYENIGMGDVFGGRYFYEKNEENKKAKLTFLADSFECEIYVLDQENLKYIPDYLQVQIILYLQTYLKRMLIEGLQLLPDYDDINTTIENKRNQQWINCKNKLYQEELNQIANPASKQLIHYKQF